MSRPPLVVVSGPPGAGKTRLIKGLAGELALPVIAKDAVKEALMDAVGAGSVEESERIGRAAFAVLYSVTSALLDAGVGAILEAAFHREPAEKNLPGLVERARAVVIHVSAPPEVIRRRCAERIEDRHPGHHDAERQTLLPALLEVGTFDAPELGVPTLRVESSAGYSPAVPEIVEWCRRRLG